jgi:hypothetical protein
MIKDQAITAKLLDKHNFVEKLCWGTLFLEESGG